MSLDRRAFLLALGAVPAAAVLLSSCSEQDAAKAPVGPDLAGADQAIRPQDDLYRHVNGTWLREYQLPPDKPSFGSFDEVGERTREQLRTIVESIGDGAAPGSDEQKIRDLYRAYLDTDAIERLGLTPVADLLAKVDAAQDKSALARTMSELGAEGVGGLIALGVGPDDKNSTQNIAFVGQSGLGLPDQSYYTDPDRNPARTGYQALLEKLAAAAQLPDPKGAATRVFELERKIAAGHWDNVRTRDPLAVYNSRTWAQLREMAPQFDWDAWLKPLSNKPELFGTVVVAEPSFVTAAGQLWGDTDIAVWREYLKLAVVRDFAAVLPKAFADPNFDFFSKQLNGVQQRPDRWKSALVRLNGTLGELVGKRYVAEHFSPEAKKAALDLVDNLRAAYKVKFENSDWMSKPTRDAAVAKLAKIEAKIGYPDTWRDYSGLTITQGKLVASLRAASVFETRREFGKLGNPVDRAEWHMNAQTTNAYYTASTNQIVFPAGILQPPFFSEDAEPAVNYGGIGAVIGHEMGHGFDDQGSQYDGDGNLRDWWTAEDKAAFDRKTKQLISQFDALVPVGLKPDQHVNGALTVGENLADLRGLLVALDAYAIAERKRGVQNPDYRPMFLTWGRIWRDKSRTEALAEQLDTDPHSPNEFRCNQVVRNVPDFYRTFDVKPADKLYLPEDQRVSI
ncbi:MAG: M13 family metallopeptidase [Mycobacteriaceae bacterium]|nr:M13 family metallopeptidase [Mycobacteriaceae bacterium]